MFELVKYPFTCRVLGSTLHYSKRLSGGSKRIKILSSYYFAGLGLEPKSLGHEPSKLPITLTCIKDTRIIPVYNTKRFILVNLYVISIYPLKHKGPFPNIRPLLFLKKNLIQFNLKRVGNNPW